MLEHEQKQFAQILDLVLARHRAGDLPWQVVEDRRSVQAKLGHRSIHIDKTEVGEKIIFVVWLLEPNNKYVERIDLDQIKVNPVGINQSFKDVFKDIFNNELSLDKEKKRNSFMNALRNT